MWLNTSVVKKTMEVRVKFDQTLNNLNIGAQKYTSHVISCVHILILKASLTIRYAAAAAAAVVH
jgi:hypothetical protein